MSIHLVVTGLCHTNLTTGLQLQVLAKISLGTPAWTCMKGNHIYQDIHNHQQCMFIIVNADCTDIALFGGHSISLTFNN